jgi:hypothetical protein
MQVVAQVRSLSQCLPTGVSSSLNIHGPDSLALGNGNSVGVIPYCLGGGTSILTAKVGYACSQITSAKVALADGTIIIANSDTEPALFWAMKGAGTFFGVVLELTLKTFPLSILGAEDGAHWVGNFMYGLDRTEEVCKVLEPMMITKDFDIAGAIMVMAPPPAFQSCLLISVHFLGDPKAAASVFKPLTDLNPVMASNSTPLFAEYRDGMDYACAKGDYKDFNLVGIPEFKTENFVQVVGYLRD